jgi:hypothetical protein
MIYVVVGMQERVECKCNQNLLKSVTRQPESVLEIADMKLRFYTHRKTREDGWTVEKLNEK